MTYRNICVNELPVSVMIDGREFFVNSGFRYMWEFERLISDPDVNEEFKKSHALELFYGDDIPDDENSAIKEMIRFYKQCKEKSNHHSRESSEILYDFEIDAEIIFADFYREYGIDLNETHLHWFKFNALFSGFSMESRMMKIIGYRSMNLSEIKDTKLKSHYTEIKKQYKIARKISEKVTDRQKKMMEILMTTGDIAGFLATERGD